MTAIQKIMGKRWLGAMGVAALLCSTVTTHATGLIALDDVTGNVYSVNKTNAALTQVGSTGLTGAGSLGLSPSNALYTITTGTASSLFAIDPNNNYSSTFIGALNQGFVSEGSMAFSPTGTAYATNGESAGALELFTINLVTGAATVVGTIAGTHDINGMAWRSDGTLAGIDDDTNSLVTINPTTASLAVVAPLTPTLGAIGDLTVVDGIAYFATAGLTPSGSGSNELWTVNLFTGTDSLVGSFAPTIPDAGISGLSPAPTVPEPASLCLLSLAGLMVSRRRRAGI
jgi:hypothetical protein